MGTISTGYLCYVKSSYVVAATEVKKSGIASIKDFCSYFTNLKFQQVQQKIRVNLTKNGSI